MFQKNVVEIKAHILCSVTFSIKSCRLRNNVYKYGTARQATDDIVIGRMRVACYVTKSINTHSEYVIPIAFPLQQWLHERASILRCTYVARLVSKLIRASASQVECMFDDAWWISAFSVCAVRKYFLGGRMVLLVVNVPTDSSVYFCSTLIWSIWFFFLLPILSVTASAFSL